jgi:hypothetical protein
VGGGLLGSFTVHAIGSRCGRGGTHFSNTTAAPFSPFGAPCGGAVYCAAPPPISQLESIARLAPGVSLTQTAQPINGEADMRLLVQWVDMRGGYTSQVAFRTDVIDQDTGKTVGFVEAERSPRARHILLFGGKYQGDFLSPEQCDAFAKGVEAVLNHVTAADEAADAA